MDEPTPPPRRSRRIALFAVLGGLLVIPTFVVATSGGSSDPAQRPAAPASFEIQEVQDQGSGMRHRGRRDCPKKHQREQQQESGDAGV